MELSYDARTAVLASENRNVFQLVDALSGKKIAEFKLTGTTEWAYAGVPDRASVIPNSAVPAHVEQAFFSADSKMLFIVSDPPNSIESTYGTYDFSAIDVPSGRLRWKASKAVSREGAILDGAPGAAASMFDLETGRIVARPEEAKPPPPHWLVARGPDGLTITDSATETTALKLVKRSVSVRSTVRWKSMQIAFEGDYQGTWDIARGKLRALPNIEPCKLTFGRAVDPNGRTLGWIEDRLAVCEHGQPDKLRIFDEALNQVTAIPLSGRDTRLVARLDAGRFLIDGTVYSSSKFAELSKIGEAVYQVSLSSDGTTFVAGRHIFDAKKMTPIAEVPIGSRVQGLPNGSFGAVQGDGDIFVVFDERSGLQGAPLHLPGRLEAWSEDGSLALVGEGEVWDSALAKTRFRGPSPFGSFSRDGQWVVFHVTERSREEKTSWEMYKTSDSGVVARGPIRPGEASLDSPISDDARFVGFGTDHGVRLVRVDTGRSLEVHLVRTDAGVEPIYVLDSGHFSASKAASARILLKTDHGDVRGDAPDVGFAREEVWVDFFAP